MLRKHYQSLHKEASPWPPQAMAFKAERCNTTLEIHSQHTDGMKTPSFTSSYQIKKIRDCCPLSYIQRNTFLTNAWQKSQDGRPSTYLQAPLSTDRMVTHLNHRIAHYTPRCHKIQGSDSIWSTYILNLIRYSKKQKGKDICHTRTWKGEWMTMHSYSCHRTKNRKQKYFLPTPNTRRLKTVLQ